MVVVITNQPVVGRGLCSEDDVQKIHDELIRKLNEENATLDKIYVCFHHPNSGIGKYRRVCSCRKPNPGMILQAEQEFNIDLSRSYLVGDKISDIKAPKDDRSVKNERWEKIKRLVESNNPAEWKVAIFEADSILEEMTQKMQIKGDTLGDRLKNAEPSDFQTLQNAWAAHKVRNNIAHQGGTFELSHKDAQEAIKNFEVVFQEFDYI